MDKDLEQKLVEFTTKHSYSGFIPIIGDLGMYYAYAKDRSDQREFFCTVLPWKYGGIACLAVTAHTGYQILNAIVGN